MPKLRRSEWILVAFFAYVVLLIPIFRDRPRLGSQPLLTLALVCALFFGLAQAERMSARYGRAISLARDWIPMALTLAAFREMELLVPRHYNTNMELGWLRWDDILLRQWRVDHIIESLGSLLPAYLEASYLLVYGVGAFCIATLWIKERRREVDRFYVILLSGTLLAYALFPYFPSEPPRIAFPGIDAPLAGGVIRRLNVFLLTRATIHTGVFPSAHVSSAFSAAWAMFAVMPQRRVYGWGLTFYAASVALATVYGRYHYAADALAGVVVSLVAAFLAWRSMQADRLAHNRHATGADTHLVA